MSFQSEPGTHRLVEKLSELEMLPMDRYGEAMPGLLWNPLRFDDTTRSGFFVVQFEPGGTSIPHEHPSAEEFYVLEGEFCDHDGYTYRAGDFVSLGAGTRHYSYSEHGALVLVWLTAGNRALHSSEPLSFGPDTVGRAEFIDVEPAQTGQIASHSRLVETVDSLPLTPFDRYGDDVALLFWNPITFDRATSRGCFVIRFEPGGVSTPHEHHGLEEFYVLDGEFMDHDGVVYTKGDLVSLGPGVRHYSYSPGGVLALAWLTDTNRVLDDTETLSFGADVVAETPIASNGIDAIEAYETDQLSLQLHREWASAHPSHLPTPYVNRPDRYQVTHHG